MIKINDYLVFFSMRLALALLSRFHAIEPQIEKSTKHQSPKAYLLQTPTGKPNKLTNTKNNSITNIFVFPDIDSNYDYKHNNKTSLSNLPLLKKQQKKKSI